MIDKKVIIGLDEDEIEIKFSVKDFGEGIKKENLLNIFKPFFTTKNVNEQKGIGLGLSMTKNIIEKDFKGTISVISEEKMGTTFFVFLKKLT